MPSGQPSSSRIRRVSSDELAVMADLESFPPLFDAIVIGASGGIGGALVAALADSDAVRSVAALSRGDCPIEHSKVRPGRIDIENEASIATAAAGCRGLTARIVIVATGLLHDGASMQPEKSTNDLDPARLARSFAVNAVGPALVIKHFAPLLPRTGKSVFAALSARVGSISDNRLGGWYGYRASKAALNQVLRTASIEFARRWREAVFIGLHPGTVATGLSEPFRSRVAPAKLFPPAHAASRLLAVLDAVQAADSGKVIAWDGKVVEP
jgi:NAD(P)-dependent dehydrogenase (short-subunit alcohol dehydrogenase family)